MTATAKDIMTTNVVSLPATTSIADAVKSLLENGYNGMPVTNDEGRVTGVLTQADLVRTQKRLKVPSVFTTLDIFIPLGSTEEMEKELRRIAAVTVGEAMSTDVFTVTPDTSVEDIATAMVERGLYTLPVVEGDKLVGVVGKADILRVVAGTST